MRATCLLGIAVHPVYSGREAPSVSAAHRPAFLSANAVLYYILTYGLTTIGAFGVVGVVERATGSDRLDAFLGLHKRNPLLAGGAAGAVSFAGGDSAAGRILGQVQSVCRGAGRFSRGRFRSRWWLWLSRMSAVSLYYYLQVLKRAYVMPAVDDSPIKAHPVTLVVLVGIAAAVVLLGCFPALLQGWINSAYGMK